MSQFSCPLDFPIIFCNDVVQYIETEAKYFITVDMESDYWKVVSEEEAQ